MRIDNNFNRTNPNFKATLINPDRSILFSEGFCKKAIEIAKTKGTPQDIISIMKKEVKVHAKKTLISAVLNLHRGGEMNPSHISSHPLGHKEDGIVDIIPKMENEFLKMLDSLS